MLGGEWARFATIFWLKLSALCRKRNFVRKTKMSGTGTVFFSSKKHYAGLHFYNCIVKNAKISDSIPFRRRIRQIYTGKFIVPRSRVSYPLQILDLCRNKILDCRLRKASLMTVMLHSNLTDLEHGKPYLGRTALRRSVFLSAASVWSAPRTNLRVGTRV
jgi:hypothetical protein